VRNERAAVALWYYGADDLMAVGLFETEADAADFAITMEDTGTNTAIGVEFPDGTIHLVDDWPEWFEAAERVIEKEEEKRNPPSPTRIVFDPFTNSPVEIPRKTPQWVGVKRLPRPPRGSGS
jgi:hypothetical protein